MTKKNSVITGAVSGFLNGLFGSAGGVFAVLLMEKFGEDSKNSHAESLAIMLPLSVVSIICYCLKGAEFDFPVLQKILPAGVIGAAAGALLMKKMSASLLKKIFGALLIFAGARGLFR